MWLIYLFNFYWYISLIFFVCFFFLFSFVFPHSEVSFCFLTLFAAFLNLVSIYFFLIACIFFQLSSSWILSSWFFVVMFHVQGSKGWSLLWLKGTLSHLPLQVVIELRPCFFLSPFEQGDIIFLQAMTISH